VGLSFSDVPERLEIPFSAVRGFYDPSVNFELEFDVKTESGAEAADKPAKQAEAKPATAKKSEPKKKPAEAAKDAPAPSTPAAKSADVVSLDSFRKK
jgi:hypothetical protein